ALVIIDEKGQPLARSGPKSAADLAKLYLKVTREDSATAPVENAKDQGPSQDQRPKRNVQTVAEESRSTPLPRENPRPWETVVRITVHSNGSLGLGSGTIVHSTPEESIILTCAHIFSLGKGAQPPPEKFPLKVTVELFDGKLG